MVFFLEIEDRKEVIMYADDTLLLGTGKTIDDSMERCQRTLHHLV